MKTDNYIKVTRCDGTATRFSRAVDTFAFCSVDRAGLEDAYARALRFAETVEGGQLCIYRRPPLEGEWSTLPEITAPLPMALPGQEDDDVPGHTGDLFGHVARGQA